MMSFRKVKKEKILPILIQIKDTLHRQKSFFRNIKSFGMKEALSSKLKKAELAILQKTNVRSKLSQSFFKKIRELRGL